MILVSRPLGLWIRSPSSLVSFAGPRLSCSLQLPFLSPCGLCCFLCGEEVSGFRVGERGEELCHEVGGVRRKRCQ